MEIDLQIERLRLGDEAELERFFHLYYPHFLSFAMSFVGDDEDVCRDIVQEVFIAYWQRRTDFRDLVRLKVFFYRSLRNRCLNELRRRHSHGQVSVAEAERLESLSTLEESVIREEVTVAVRRGIDRLPPQSRNVLLQALGGKSNPEIAEALGLSVNTVKTHKLKTYQALRQRLKELHVLLGLLTVV